MLPLWCHLPLDRCRKLTVLVNRAMLFGSQPPRFFFKPPVFCYSNETWTSRKQGTFSEKLTTMNSIPTGPAQLQLRRKKRKMMQTFMTCMILKCVPRRGSKTRHFIFPQKLMQTTVGYQGPAFGLKEMLHDRLHIPVLNIWTPCYYQHNLRMLYQSRKQTSCLIPSSLFKCTILEGYKAP